MPQFFAPSSHSFRFFSCRFLYLIPLVFLSACCCPKSGENYTSSGVNNQRVPSIKGLTSSVYNCTNGTVIPFDDVTKIQKVVFACAGDVLVWNYTKYLSSPTPVEITVFFPNKDPFDGSPTATITSTNGLATSPRVQALSSDYAPYDYTVTIRGTGESANVHVIVLGN